MHCFDRAIRAKSINLSEFQICTVLVSPYLGFIFASKSEASVLHKHESEHHQNAPAEWKMKVYNYHSKPLRRQIEEGVLINNARGGELLNSKSEMTRGGKIPRLVIMVGDKEVHNVCSERKQVEAHTH